MSNVLDRVDAEIALQRRPKEEKPDTAKYSLSKPLISKIVALSRAFRPYRMLEEGDTLSYEFVSPERGQLFISLMENNLDNLTQNTIVSSGDFFNAVIGVVRIRGANLSQADLIGTDLRGADLGGAEGLIFEKLVSEKAFYEAIGLATDLKKRLGKEKSCLFKDPDGLQKCPG